MFLETLRFDHDKESTSGLLSINNKFECFSLEDQRQQKKVQNETRVWDGIYELGIRNELTPLTQKYREKHPWFEYHIEIMNIPEFTGVYIHIGNTEKDTAACLLVARQIIDQGDIEDRLVDSTNAFEAFYKKVYPVLKSGQHSQIRFSSIWLPNYGQAA